MAKRYAVLIGSGDYPAEPKLSNLRCPLLGLRQAGQAQLSHNHIASNRLSCPSPQRTPTCPP